MVGYILWGEKPVKLTVSISSPSSEGGGCFLSLLGSCWATEVSISSPSSEGGGPCTNFLEGRVVKKFPLVLLQAKVVGKVEVEECVNTPPNGFH